jgi:TPR repeat protein
MLEAIAGVLLLAAPVKDPAKEALAHAKEVTPPPSCPECRDTCASPPQQKCKDMCKAGNVMACSAIGQAYVRAVKLEDAYPLLVDAAAKHEKGAEVALAALYLAEHSPYHGKADPLPLLGEACGLQDGFACVMLGQIYEDKKDKKSALELYERACSGGFAEACLSGAKLADKAKAAKLTQAACSLGKTDACPKKPAEKSAPRSK